MEEEYKETPTKFTIETTDRSEINLYVNAYKLLLALEELKEYRRELYKGYSNDVLYLINGYKYEGLDKKTDVKCDEGKSIQVIDTDKVIDKIDDILSDIYQFLE